MEENKIIDSTSWKGSDEKYNFREIVLRQVSRIATLGSREMRAGWWKKTYGTGGVEIISSYIGDSRDEYIEAVNVLHDLLQPKFDKEMQKFSKEFNEEETKTHKEFLNQQEKSKGNMSEKWTREKLKFARRMFQKLCFFLNRIGWLETISAEE